MLFMPDRRGTAGRLVQMLDRLNQPNDETGIEQSARTAGKLLNAKEAAAHLGVCEKTLWNARERGEIQAVRMGRRVLYDPQDLARWIETHKSTGPVAN